MRFTNFSLRNGNRGVELEAFGHNWDLHNCVDFRGFHFDCASGDLVVEWVPPAEFTPNVWGDPTNHALFCRIRFSGLRLLHVGPRDDEYPPSESTCVSEIDLISTDGRKRLVFTLQDERKVEIAADSATLERELPPTAPA